MSGPFVVILTTLSVVSVTGLTLWLLSPGDAGDD